MQAHLNDCSTSVPGQLVVGNEILWEKMYHLREYEWNQRHTWRTYSTARFMFVDVLWHEHVKSVEWVAGTKPLHWRRPNTHTMQTTQLHTHIHITPAPLQSACRSNGISVAGITSPQCCGNRGDRLVACRKAVIAGRCHCHLSRMW